MKMMRGLRMSTTFSNQRLYPHSQPSAWAQGGTARAVQAKLVTLKAVKASGRRR